MSANRLARNSAFGAIAGLFTNLSNFGISVVLARTLGVDGTGGVTYALWLITITTTVADLGVPASLARYLPELTASGQSEEAAGLTATLFRRYVVSIMGLALSVAGVAVWIWLRQPSTDVEQSVTGNPFTVLLIGLCCAGQGLAAFAIGYHKGMQRFDDLARITMASVLVQIAATALGSHFFGVDGALAGNAAGNVLMAASAIKAGEGTGRASPDLTARVNRYAMFTWAAGAAAAFAWARIEVVFLERSWGHESVGLFMVGLTLSSMAVQGPMLLTTGLLPFLTERFGENAIDKMREAYATGTRLMAFMLFPACFGTAAIMPGLLPLIYGRQFEAGVPAAEILVAAAALGSATVGSNVVYAMERSDFIFYSGLVGLVLSTASGFLVIPVFGVIGAACSRALVQIILVALGQWFLARRLRFSAPYGSLAALLCAALICAGVARLLIVMLPDPLGIPIAILGGAVAYFGVVRALGALPASDAERLIFVVRSLPLDVGRFAVPVLKLMVG